LDRRDKQNYYLDIAETVLERGTCLRRNYGSIIVKNDEIISTGYTGAPRGRKNCIDLNRCIREELKVPSVLIMNFAEVCIVKLMPLLVHQEEI
jgi:dCMP deaminase